MLNDKLHQIYLVVLLYLKYSYRFGKKMVHKSMKWFNHLKYISCIPIEAVCFIFGIISCVLSIFFLTMLILAVIFIEPEEAFRGFTRDANGEVGQYENLSPDFSYVYLNYEALPLTSFFTILFNFFGSSFFFSVVLCYGIHKRKPLYLKVYLVFGLAVTGFMLLVFYYFHNWLAENGDTIIAIHINENRHYYVTSLVVAFGMWLLILNLVMRAHQLFRAEKYKYHRLLQHPLSHSISIY